MDHDLVDALIERIKSRTQNFGDTDKCWPWQGAHTKAGPRMQMMRDSEKRPYFQPTVVSSYGLVKYKGRRLTVHKLMFEWLRGPSSLPDGYRLRNQCGDTLCCNPTHWYVVGKEFISSRTPRDLDTAIELMKARIENFGQSEACWPWLGATTKAGPRAKRTRDSQMRPYYQPTFLQPYGRFRLGGHTYNPHRLVFERAGKTPDLPENYRLRNQCGNTLCCNPSHWMLKERFSVEVMFTQTTPHFAQTSTDLKHDCRELLESMLAVTQPRCFNDVAGHPYMLDFPHPLIKEILHEIGKPHLAT